MNKASARKLNKLTSDLQKAIYALPEYERLMNALPSNHSLSLSISEEGTTKKLTDNVTYEGLTVEKGENSYLVQICGLSYFTSKLTHVEIANLIQMIYTQERENPTLKEGRSDWKGYSFELRVSLRIASLLNATDEVYPHMRDSAIGTFIVDSET